MEFDRDNIADVPLDLWLTEFCKEYGVDVNETLVVEGRNAVSWVKISYLIFLMNKSSGSDKFAIRFRFVDGHFTDGQGIRELFIGFAMNVVP